MHGIQRAQGGQPVQDLQPALNDAPQGPAPVEDAVQMQFSAAMMAKYEESRSTAITIETQDGDSVRLFINPEFGFQAGSAGVVGEDGSAFATHSSSYQKISMGFSVEGELDGDELKAIRKVFNKVEKIADKFFDGNVEKAASKLEMLVQKMDTDELAGIDVALSRRRSLQLAAVYQIAPATSAPGEALPDSETPAAADPDVVTPAIVAADETETEESEPADENHTGTTTLNVNSLMEQFNDLFDELFEDDLFPQPGQLIAGITESVVQLKFSYGEIDAAQHEDVQSQLQEPLEALKERDDA